MDAGLNERTLRRIIALLVSFAALAERAAGRSFPVRWMVLVVLRHAEAVAQGYLTDTTGLDWTACFEDDPEPGSRPDDAALLAWRFRMLAAMLGTLLPPEDPFDRLDGWMATGVATRHAFASFAVPGFVAPGGWPHRAPDTS